MSNINICDIGAIRQVLINNNIHLAIITICWTSKLMPQKVELRDQDSLVNDNCISVM